METAPEEKRMPVPHSKEQISSMRQQRNVFTWNDSGPEKTTPSRKIGVGAYKGYIFIYIYILYLYKVYIVIEFIFLIIIS